MGSRSLLTGPPARLAGREDDIRRLVMLPWHRGGFFATRWSTRGRPSVRQSAYSRGWTRAASSANKRVASRPRRAPRGLMRCRPSVTSGPRSGPSALSADDAGVHGGDAARRPHLTVVVLRRRRSQRSTQRAKASAPRKGAPKLHPEAGARLPTRGEAAGGDLSRPPRWIRGGHLCPTSAATPSSPPSRPASHSTRWLRSHKLDRFGHRSCARRDAGREVAMTASKLTADR